MGFTEAFSAKYKEVTGHDCGCPQRLAWVVAKKRQAERWVRRKLLGDPPSCADKIAAMKAELRERVQKGAL